MRPEDTQGATYTISNVGSFGNLMGTPIIPQPQVAILAVGAIVKNLLYWKLGRRCYRNQKSYVHESLLRSPCSRWFFRWDVPKACS